jgi:hypothetical protein
LTSASDDGLCAFPPGTIASDGQDDVCPLVACCTGSGNQASVDVVIPSGAAIFCAGVNCMNVCNLAIQRTGLGTQACSQACIPQSPPAPSHYACLDDLVNTFVRFYGREFTLANLALPFIHCLDEIVMDRLAEPISQCQNACTCPVENETICTTLLTACKSGCVLDNIPGSCKSFILNLAGDILSPTPIGLAAEVVALLGDAVLCLEPGQSFFK